MAAGFLFAAPAAHAQITCQDVPGGSGDWPYNGFTHYCTNTSYSNALNMAVALDDILDGDQAPLGKPAYQAGYVLKNYPTLLSPTLGAQFWLFDDHGDFYDYCQSDYGDFGYQNSGQCPTLTNEIGYSVPGNGYVVVFESGHGPGDNIKSITAHEAGHLLDYSGKWRTLLGTGGATASDSSGFQSELNQDWTNLNDPSEYNPCDTPRWIFLGKKDASGNYICNSDVLASDYSGFNENVLKQAWPYYFNPHGYAGASYSSIVSGTPTTNDVLTITITDSYLSTSPQNVSYTVQSGDTLADIAEGLKDAINSNSVLSTGLITADSTGSTTKITMRSRSSTTFSWSVTGGQTEALTLIGNGSASNRELFAEAFAKVSGNTTTGNQSPQNHFQNNQFRCIRELIYSMQHYGEIPGQTGSVMSWPAGQDCPSICPD